MSREMAASGAMDAQRYRTRLLCAQRKENVTCLAAASDDPAQRAPRTCLSLAQGQRACAPRSLAAVKFYSIKFPHSLGEMLVILTRCNGAQLTQDLRAKSIR